MSTGQTNRAEEFKNNSNYDYVKNEILNDLAPNYEYTAGDVKYQTKTEERYQAEKLPEGITNLSMSAII